MRRIGVLSTQGADDPDTRAQIEAFLQGLAQLGWTDGRNARIDTRWATANVVEIRKHAAELAPLAPDVILANGAATVDPLLQVTRTVPIVFVGVGDPVGSSCEIPANPPRPPSGFWALPDAFDLAISILSDIPMIRPLDSGGDTAAGHSQAQVAVVGALAERPRSANARSATLSS
jgi:hypothetical protein